MFACAEAMRVEYQAIIDAGFVLQLDDPALATSWDMINPEPSVADYRGFAELRVEALNHALRGLPADRIRYHLCWGSWHGPHVTDIPMRDLVDIVLKVNAQAISFEAGNVRHEHEWKVWRDVKLPRRQAADPRRGQPRDQRYRASSTGRRPPDPLRRRRRPGKRARRHRLRPRRTRAPRHRLGETPHPRRGGRVGVAAVVVTGRISRGTRWPF